MILKVLQNIEDIFVSKIYAGVSTCIAVSVFTINYQSKLYPIFGEEINFRTTTLVAIACAIMALLSSWGVRELINWLQRIEDRRKGVIEKELDVISSRLKGRLGAAEFKKLKMIVGALNKNQAKEIRKILN